jgi:hypothetical protein
MRNRHNSNHTKRSIAKSKVHYPSTNQNHLSRPHGIAQRTNDTRIAVDKEEVGTANEVLSEVATTTTIRKHDRESD